MSITKALILMNTQRCGEAQGRVEGVPSSIRTLIDDAEDIDEMLKELADALVDVEQGLPGEDEEDEEDGD